MNKSLTEIIQGLKTSARHRGKKYDLPQEVVGNLISQTRCAYSGKSFDECRMSFERIDCDKGYIVGNVIVVDQIINNARNTMKSDSDVDAFELLVEHEVLKTIKAIDRLKQKQFTTETLISNWAAKQLDEQPPFDFELARRTFVNRLIAQHARLETFKAWKEAVPHIRYGINKFFNLTPDEQKLIDLGLPLA